MPPAEQPSVKVTLEDIYHQVSALREDVAAIKAAVPDHEARVRILEKWSYALPPTFILALASIVVTLLRK